MAPPYRADHVGSLLRPPEVLEARKALDERRITREQFNAIADKAILKALDLQRDVGIDVYTDGEYRRSWWAGAWADALDGLIADAQPLASPFRGPGWQGPGAESARAVLAEVFKPAVVGAKLRLARRLNGDEAAFLRQHAPGPWKITMAGVASRGAAQFRPGLTEPFYATPDDLDRELAGFMRQEMEALIDEGCSYIQVDSLRYTSWMGPRLQQMIESGVDYMKDLEDQIARSLGAWELPGGSLRLEITESGVMDHAETAVELLRRLRHLGVCLDLDDFGTGYSSLSYLHRFELDALKVDRVFVRTIGAKGENAEIARTIVGLARSLGLDVIAEGVETREQLDVILALGCELVQGHLFAPALSAEAARALLATGILG